MLLSSRYQCVTGRKPHSHSFSSSSSVYIHDMFSISPAMPPTNIDKYLFNIKSNARIRRLNHALPLQNHLMHDDHSIVPFLSNPAAVVKHLQLCFSDFF